MGDAGLNRGPDPRVVRSRQAALTAAQELLAEEGLTGVTHVTVAARSGIGRTTLYRHWPDATALLYDAIVQRMDQIRRVPTGDLRTDLTAELNGLRHLLQDPVTEHGMRALLERAPFDPAMGKLKEALYQAGTSGFRAILEAGRARGELVAGPDTEVVVDQLVGPLFYRRLFADRDIDADYVDRIVADVLRLHGTAAP
jgi:AcrR family transcriptional regulator